MTTHWQAKQSKQTRALGVPLGKRRFYVVRIVGEAPQASADSAAHAASYAYAVLNEGAPVAGYEWCAVYAHCRQEACNRALGKRVKWRPYTGVGSTVLP